MYFTDAPVWTNLSPYLYLFCIVLLCVWNRFWICSTFLFLHVHLSLQVLFLYCLFVFYHDDFLGLSHCLSFHLFLLHPIRGVARIQDVKCAHLGFVPSIHDPRSSSRVFIKIPILLCTSIIKFQQDPYTNSFLKWPLRASILKITIPFRIIQASVLWKISVGSNLV